MRQKSEIKEQREKWVFPEKGSRDDLEGKIGSELPGSLDKKENLSHSDALLRQAEGAD